MTLNLTEHTTESVTIHGREISQKDDFRIVIGIVSAAENHVKVL